MTAPAPAGPRGRPDPRGTLTADEISGRASGPVLVGRDQQMAALEAAFADARQGGPTAVLLGGEAGVGKSRLVGEFGQAATAAGACVLVGGVPGAGHRRAAVRAVHRDAPRPGPRARRGGGGLDAARPDHARAGPAAAGARRARYRPGYRPGPGRGPGAAVRGDAQRAGSPGPALAGGAGDRGRALGRPLQPGPADLPDRQPAGHRRAADHRDVPVRRAAPHPPAAPDARRAGPDRLGRADRAAEADQARHRRAGRGDPRPPARRRRGRRAVSPQRGQPAVRGDAAGLRRRADLRAARVPARPAAGQRAPAAGGHTGGAAGGQRGRPDHRTRAARRRHRPG